MTSDHFKPFWDQAERMVLKPRLQPGMLKRKAGLFAHEIVQLHQAGYSYAEIQLLLSDIGLTVSKTTISREIARWRKSLPPPATSPTTPALMAAPEKPVQAARREAPSPVERAPQATSDASTEVPAGSSAAVPLTSDAPRPPSLADDPRTGMQVADEFFRTHISNPLFKQGKKS